MNTADGRIYPIFDLATIEVRGLDAASYAKFLLGQSPRWLQLRAKGYPEARVAELAKLLMRMTEGTATELVLNDHAALAAELGVPYVHLGQSDERPDAVRAQYPKLKIGVSTHTLQQVQEALKGPAAYVAYGPLFSTVSKENHEAPVGLEGLRAAHELVRAAQVATKVVAKVEKPLIAIGGITLDLLPLVLPYCAAAAMISALADEFAQPAKKEGPS
jgi:thiamine-phosphate pyrophosphorylase